MSADLVPSPPASAPAMIMDGNYLAARAAFAVPPTVSDGTGRPINGTYGFIASLCRLVTTIKPRTVAVAFDHRDGPSFRGDVFTSYKAGRVKLPENFAYQIELAREALRRVGIPTFSVEAFEADDVIASLARAVEGSADHVIVVSGDKDLFQVIRDPFVRLLLSSRSRTGRESLLDERAARVLVGVWPNQYADFLALCGDPSDNVPGIDRIGPKTAAELLGEFGDVDGILAHLDDVPRRLRGSLESNQVRLRATAAALRLVDALEFDSPLGASVTSLVVDSTVERWYQDRGLGPLARRLREAILSQQESPSQGVPRLRSCHVVLVGCSARKLDNPSAARDLYTSPMFVASRAYAERNADKWFVVSGYHGLVDPDDVVAPYDFSLGAQTPAEQSDWGERAASKLAARVPETSTVTILAGPTYSSAIGPALRRRGFRLDEPLAGLSVGKHNEWLWSQHAASDSGGPHDVEAFYAQLGRLADATGVRRFGDSRASIGLPQRGVYFFFEPGEIRADGTARIVRVGTHAVSRGSKSTLWSRLRAHRGVGSGGGSHRSSIFRLHLGMAVLEKSGRRAEYPTWGVGATAGPDVKARESTVEREVSAYIAEMSFVVLPVMDAPSVESDRAFVERHAIALLAAGGAIVDPPSTSWLGRYSPRPEIRRTGLWNLDHISAWYDQRFVEVFGTLVECASRGVCSSLDSLAPEGWLALSRHNGAMPERLPGML